MPWRNSDRSVVNIFDPFRPQAFNVDIGGEHEIADDQPRHPFEAAPIPYDVPPVVAIEPDSNLYPKAPYGVWITGF